MQKKIMLCCLLFLFSVNSTSIILFGIRLPLFVLFTGVLGIIISCQIVLDFKKKDWQSLKNNYMAKGNRYFLIFMILWLAYAMFTVLWQRDYQGWRVAVNFLIIGNFCAFVFPFFIKNVKDLFRVYYCMGTAVILHNLIGWFEVITRIYLFPSSGDAEIWNRRPVSLFYNTNNFAVFLLLGIFICYVNFKVQQNVMLKRICVISMLSSTALIFLTRSRGTVIALAVGVLIFIVVTKYEKIVQTVINLLKRRVYLICSCILLALLLVSSYFVVRLMFFTGARAASGIVRTNLIRNGFLFLGITNGFGVGAGNIEHWMNNYWGYRTIDMINMHNWWMEILIAYGIPILISYLVFYIMLVKSTFVRYKKTSNPDEKAIHLANICILGSFVIASMIPSSMMPAIWFWVFMGVLIAAQKESIYE